MDSKYAWYPLTFWYCPRSSDITCIFVISASGSSSYPACWYSSKIFGFSSTSPWRSPSSTSPFNAICTNWKLESVFNWSVRYSCACSFVISAVSFWYSAKRGTAATRSFFSVYWVLRNNPTSTKISNIAIPISHLWRSSFFHSAPIIFLHHLSALVIHNPASSDQRSNEFPFIPFVNWISSASCVAILSRSITPITSCPTPSCACIQ